MTTFHISNVMIHLQFFDLLLLVSAIHKNMILIFPTLSQVFVKLIFVKWKWRLGG